MAERIAKTVSLLGAPVAVLVLTVVVSPLRVGGWTFRRLWESMPEYMEPTALQLWMAVLCFLAAALLVLALFSIKRDFERGCSISVSKYVVWFLVVQWVAAVATADMIG